MTTTSLMHKLDVSDPEMRSADIVAQNVEQLKSSFPDAFTEGKVDFEVLKQLLGGAVEEREEKYGLNWHGKRRARQLALTPSLGTLRPCPDESVDWESTQNLMIEGDNLEVLKLLQKSYAAKVRMIYIDPPYNTGKDFVYPDDYKDGIRNYLELTGQLDSGLRISSNTESSGRFHTDWLNMMYPRLLLARNLLRDDGVIFLSIDDNEIDNLRKLCADVFGEDNFLAQFVWNNEGHSDNQFDIKVNHEYVVLFAKNADSVTIGHVIDPNTREESNLWKGFAENSITKNGPGNPPSEIELPVGFPCASEAISLPPSAIPQEFFEAARSHSFISRELTDRFAVTYPIRRDDMKVRESRLVSPVRVFSGWANANKLRAFIQNDCNPIEDGGDQLSFFLSERGVIYYRRNRLKARNILTVLRSLGTTEKMSSELEALGVPFQYPKPKELLRYLLQIGIEGNGIVLDFFAGSGATGLSVYAQNLSDSSERRFILVQLPEPLSGDVPAQRAGALFCESIGRSKNVAEITKESLRRTTRQLKVENPLLAGDLGFRVFKLDSSNIIPWEPRVDELGQALLDHEMHIAQDRVETDILYELIIKLGLDLCVPIEERFVAGKAVYSVGGGVLIACLTKQITTTEVESLALGIVDLRAVLAPAGDTMCVFRDSAFDDDVAKSNLAAILNQHGIASVRSL